MNAASTSVLRDLGQAEEADHLEAAAVGQQAALPTHEHVQPARLAQPPLLCLLFHDPPPPPMRTSYLEAPLG